jgi:MoaA/NifB/PqqE/SkfB family radical SAM enzyme
MNDGRPSEPVVSREDNLLLYRESRVTNSPDCPNLPLTPLVEVTSRCNLSCSMCNIHFNTRSGMLMPVGLLEQTFGLSRVASMVHPFGLGEPLLHPDIVPIVGRYKAEEVFVGLITNGMLLNEDVSNGLIENRLDQIVISVDAADPDLFAKIRRGGDLKRISDNIKTLNRLKETLSAVNPVPAINVVVQAGNFSQLPDIVRLAEDWNIHFITFTPVTVHEHIAGIQDMAVGPDTLNREEILEVAGKEAELRGVCLDTQRLCYVLEGKSPDEVYDGVVPCPEPFRFMGIRANGDIFPCCNWSLDDPIANLSGSSDIKLSDFIGVWRNNKMQELREMVVSGRYPEHCRKCMSNFTRPFLDGFLELKAEVE